MTNNTPGFSTNTPTMNCRHCHSPLSLSFADLNTAPPSNAYLKPEDLSKPEPFYPLRTMVCTQCWLVQTQDFTSAEDVFTPEYGYFSSMSSSWLEHAKTYVNQITQRLELNNHHFVVEIASNDGYLLKNFKEKNIPCLGIEPTHSTAEASKALGIETLESFFGESLARELAQNGNQADLIIGNNVYAHVPDLNDFTAGLRQLLKPEGTITLEFPHLKNLVDLNQFDTIYHEHFSYFSLCSVCGVLESHALRVYDVEQIPTHGGSLRLFICHKDALTLPEKPAVAQLLTAEMEAGMQTEAYYTNMQSKIRKVRAQLWQFLLEKEAQNAKVAAYGAAAKGNTLLNYCGVKDHDIIRYVVDASEYKKGRFMPGSRIPIVALDHLLEDKPDFILIFPWNLKKEIQIVLQDARSWGAQFVTFIPELKVD